MTEALMLLLSLLSLTHAGELDVTVRIDDDVRTATFRQVPSCLSSRTTLDSEDAWSVRALATAIDADGTVYVDLDVEAGAQRGRAGERVKTHPQFVVKPDEPALVRMETPDQVVEVTVVARDFDLDTRCYPLAGDTAPPPQARAERGEHRQSRAERAERVRTE